jgi:hypothetical protein
LPPVVRSVLDYEAYGDWGGDPVAGGFNGLAWIVTLTASGNVAQARAATVAHLVHEFKLDVGDALVVPRMKLFAPYLPADGLRWDIRTYPDVRRELATITKAAS